MHDCLSFQNLLAVGRVLLSECKTACNLPLLAVPPFSTYKSFTLYLNMVHSATRSHLRHHFVREAFPCSTTLVNVIPAFSVVHSLYASVQSQSFPTLCNPMNRSTPGLPVHHQLLEFTQTYVHWVGDAIQPSHPLSSPSPALNLSQHQGLFQWVSSSPHQVAKVLEFQLQHQSFQWTPRTDLF